MNKGRLEAFSDGVIAIIITIMVLELKAPHEHTLEGLQPLLPALLSYILSFIYVGLYWNNHHHLLHAARHISGMTLWANLHLLFWLSLVPFTTSWMGESHFAALPVAAYGLGLLMCGVAWKVLTTQLVRSHGKGSTLDAAIGNDFWQWVSLGLYLAGIIVALAGHRLSADSAWPGIGGCIFYAIVAAMWIIPDRRIERAITGAE